MEGLRRGKTEAPEGEPVRPVPEEHVAAVLPHVGRQVKAMIELQSLTGMRPGEAVIMRTRDIDTTGKLWLYRPQSHKTQNAGHERVVYLGPRAQAIVAPWLRPNLDEYLFQPREVDAKRRAKQHAERKTPLSCGNVPGSNRKHRPGREPGNRYTVDSYRRAIAAGCEVAFEMPAELREPATPKQRRERAGEDAKARRNARAEWHARHVWAPNRLRHNAATRLRKDYGLEAAQVILGHQTLTVTQVYAEKNVAAAHRIMAEVG